MTADPLTLSLRFAAMGEVWLSRTTEVKLNRTWSLESFVICNADKHQMPHMDGVGAKKPPRGRFAFSGGVAYCRSLKALATGESSWTLMLARLTGIDL